MGSGRRLVVLRLAFYARLGSPKITISQRREDLITRMRKARAKPMRDHEKLGAI